MNDRSYAQLIDRTIVPGDTMFQGNEDYYFEVGESALAAIEASLAAAGVTKVESVLDYACGYGRVLRWLKARFPSARILASDLDSKGLAAVGATLGIETRPARVDCAESLGESFDLIWSGSLLTHLSELDAGRVLKFLLDHLSPSGVLVFTTHGPYVERRIAGEKLYGLETSEADRLLEDYRSGGYGFGAYPKQKAYGISAVIPSKMMCLIEQTDGRPIYYQERGWIRHQDVYAVSRRGGC